MRNKTSFSRLNQRAVFWLLNFVILILISCGPRNLNKEIDEGNIEGEIYRSIEIGWTIVIPEGWEIMDKDKIEASEQKSKVAMEKVADQELDIKNLKHLISFKKDPFNVFTSTSEPFKEDFPGEFQENNQKIYALIYNTLVDQGIKVDTSSGRENIQGLEFNTFHTTVYSPKGEIILSQILYNKLINGYSFGVTLSYNNLDNKKIMLNAWKNSQFDKLKN